MTPKFAQQVDPVFLRVIDILESIDAGRQPSAERERRTINDQLRRAESELSRENRQVWELAKYGMVAWIDEMLVNADEWQGKAWWLNNSLEWEHFRSSEAHEMFFVKAKEAGNTPAADDALETFYVCVLLGFRGFYGDGSQSERIQLVATRFDVPTELPKWADDAARVINARRRELVAAADADAPEYAVHTAKPLWGRARLVWPWLLAALVAGLDVLVGYYSSH